MILKKQVYTTDKRANPLIGILLFFLSLVLFVFTAPLGLVYGIFQGLYKRGLKGLSEYLLQVAISIDQLGNVIMQHVLNLLWLKKGSYKFGNRDETISSALGRNHKMGTLSKFGKSIDRFLDLIDSDHSLNSIDYYIEPTPQIIDRLVWIHVVNHELLILKLHEKTNYSLPGGTRKIGESDAEALSRIIKEELGVVLEIPSLKYIGVFETPVDGHRPGLLIRTTCYSAVYSGVLAVDAKIREIAWLRYRDRGKVSETDKLILDLLKKSGQLI